MKRILRVSIALSSFWSVQAAQAQTPPDAGALRQQIEKGLPLMAPHPKTAEPLTEPQPRSGPKGATLTVQEFRFVGNTLIDSDHLAAAIDSYRDHPIDFIELQQAVQAVAKAYRKAGWVVHTFLPHQDATNGIVTIQIVEAVFGGVSFEGEEPKRVPFSQLLAIVEEQQKIGTPLRAGALDRALLLADDLPGVNVSGSLRAGDSDAETQLLLSATDEPLVTGYAGIDNGGALSTGSKRTYATANWNSPNNDGDQVSANVLHTDGSNYLRLGWTTPKEHDGWRVGLNTSTLDYKLISQDFSGLDGKGSSSSVGAEASYPLIRAQQRNLFLQLNSDFKWFDNHLNGFTTSNYSLWNTTAALNGNLMDELGGGGTNTLSVAWTNGTLNLDGSPNQASDAATTRSAGQFSKFRYSVSREQTLENHQSLIVSLAGQFAKKNLDSSEKFYLGGPDGVRAYPTNEGGGSEGMLVNVELRRKLDATLSVSGFVDWGQVTVNRDNNFAGAVVHNVYSMNGVGVSMTWHPRENIEVRTTWAHRLTENPNPTPLGNDQNGTHVQDRIWFLVSARF